MALGAMSRLQASSSAEGHQERVCVPRCWRSLVAQGRIQSIIDRIFPPEDVAMVFEALRQGNALGRNVGAV